MKAVRRLLVVLAITVAGLAATSTPASAAIRVRMEVTKVPQGQWAYASGQIDVGQKIVFVQRWNGSRWYDITGATVYPDGSFRAALKPKDRGIYTFRVRSKSGRTISPKFYLNVTGPVAFSKSGTGGTVTNYFNLPTDWVGTISADCSNTEYGSGYFGVKLFYSASYGPTYDLVANEIPRPRWSTTFTTYRAVGRAYITVETDCAWSIRIVGR
jgi:hypothetical protein